jgi:hypothetical protein
LVLEFFAKYAITSEPEMGQMSFDLYRVHSGLPNFHNVMQWCAKNFDDRTLRAYFNCKTTHQMALWKKGEKTSQMYKLCKAGVVSWWSRIARTNSKDKDSEAKTLALINMKYFDERIFDTGLGDNYPVMDAALMIVEFYYRKELKIDDLFIDCNSPNMSLSGMAKVLIRLYSEAELGKKEKVLVKYNKSYKEDMVAEIKKAYESRKKDKKKKSQDDADEKADEGKRSIMDSFHFHLSKAQMQDLHSYITCGEQYDNSALRTLSLPESLQLNGDWSISWDNARSKLGRKTCQSYPDLESVIISIDSERNISRFKRDPKVPGKVVKSTITTLFNKEECKESINYNPGEYMYTKLGIKSPTLHPYIQELWVPVFRIKQDALVKLLEGKFSGGDIVISDIVSLWESMELDGTKVEIEIGYYNNASKFEADFRKQIKFDTLTLRDENGTAMATLQNIDDILSMPNVYEWASMMPISKTITENERSNGANFSNNKAKRILYGRDNKNCAELDNLVTKHNLDM